MGSINLSELVRHLSDSVKHITAAERTAWNAKADKAATAVYQSVSDIDTITESGLYRITSSAGLLLHITWDTNYMLQIRNVNGGRLSWRTKAGTWGAWSDVADGGNASKVGGKPISDLASADDNYWLYTYAANGNKHGAAHRIKATHHAKGDYRFHLQCESGEEVGVDHATDADTLDGYHAADLRSAPTAGSGTVGGSTAATVTLGYKPSMLLVVSRQTSNSADRNCAVLLHSGHQSGDFTVNASTGGNSATVTVALTATGFTVSAPGQNYSYPFDYIAYK